MQGTRDREAGADREPGELSPLESARLLPRVGDVVGERRRAAIRLGVVVVGAVVFGLLPSPAPHGRTVVWACIGAAAVYSAALFFASRVVARHRPRALVARAGDTAILLAAIALTGGLGSPWVPGVYVIVASVALRFSVRTTIVSSLASAVGLALVAAANGQLRSDLATLVIAIGWMLVMPMAAAITSRGRERHLASRLRLLALTQEVGKVGTWEWRIEENQLVWSPELHRIFGVPETLEPTLERFMGAVHPDDRADLQRTIDATLRGATPFRVDHRVVLPDGTIRWVHCRGRLMLDAGGRPSELVGSSLDVTDLRLMKMQLESADKLASLGTMASGIAHEINNPLSYLANHVAILERRLADTGRRDAAADDAFGAIKHALGRVRDIVHGLKTVSREDRDRREPVDVAHTAEMAIAVAAHAIGPTTKLVRSYDEVPPVIANESRLSQVIVNLLVNAAQSFESETPDNEIRIAIEARDGEVSIAVSDTGSGIPPEVTGRIFDPFFTTKPTGVGTGLGLSICQGIVHELGGSIHVTSEAGRGSRFEVLLPASPEEKPAPPPSTPERVRGLRRARILVVDDEPRFARSLALLLGEDHDVEVTSNVEDALASMRRQAPFDLVLCDLMMPKMTGMDMYARLTEDERRRIVFLTGGPTTDRARAFLAHPAVRHLEKPIDAMVLERLVADEALGGASPAPAAPLADAGAAPAGP